MSHPPLREAKFRLVQSLDDALDLKRWLGERRDVLAFDTETGGLDSWAEPLRLVQFGDPGAGWAVPWDDWAGLVKEVFASWDGPLVGHNAMFDLRFLERNGVKIRRDRVNDTMVLSHLDDPTGAHGLKPLTAKHIDLQATAGQEALKEGMVKQGWTWATVPVDFTPYWAYAALDCTLTARLWDKFAPVRQAYAEVYELEMAVAQILSDMHVRGMRIDVEYTRRKQVELEDYCAQVYEWVEGNYGVKPGSNLAVANRLLADGVRLEKRTDKGAWSVDSEVLKGLDHPLAQAVLNHRNVKKVSSSYFRSILNRLDGDLIHCDIRPLGARTGRMSIANPPLQQLPSRSPLVRNCFVARPEHTLAMIDYDNIEMRLLAHYSGERTMIEAICAGGDSADLHMFTAQMLFGLNAGPKERKIAKTINFAKAYGAGPAKMALQLGQTEDEARAFVQRYDAAFPGVRSFIDQVEATGTDRERSTGQAFIINGYGRRVPKSREDGMYVLTNYVMQSTAADVLKTALVRLDNAGLSEYALLPVHDELIFEFPAENAQEMAAAAAEAMREMDKFSVPLSVGVDIHGRWGDKYAA